MTQANLNCRYAQFLSSSEGNETPGRRPLAKLRKRRRPEAKPASRKRPDKPRVGRSKRHTCAENQLVKQPAFRLLAEAVNAKRIRPLDENAANKLMRYVPYWA
jgi:hypothetical protein